MAIGFAFCASVPIQRSSTERIQNLQGKLFETIRIDETATLYHSQHQEVHEKHVFCGEESYYHKFPDQVIDESSGRFAKGTD